MREFVWVTLWISQNAF